MGKVIFASRIFSIFQFTPSEVEVNKMPADLIPVEFQPVFVFGQLFEFNTTHFHLFSLLPLLEKKFTKIN